MTDPAPKKKIKIKDSRKKFCHEYVKHFNGARAAIDAKYSKRSARQIASELLTKPDVAEYLERLLAKINKKLEVTEDRILEEYACIAFFDINDVLDEYGNILPISEIPEAARRAIAGLDIDELWKKTKDGAKQIGDSKKLKLCSKEKALDALSKYKQMFIEKKEVKHTFNIMDVAKGIKD